MLPSVLRESPVALVAFRGMSGRSTSAIERIMPVNRRSLTTFGPLLIDKRIYLMDESPVALGEIDADIVRRRADPYGLAVEGAGAAEDPQMMPLREGIVALLISHVGDLTIQNQNRHGAFLITAGLDQRPGSLQFRFRVQSRGRGPACLLERRAELVIGRKEHDVSHV